MTFKFYTRDTYNLALSIAKSVVGDLDYTENFSDMEISFFNEDARDRVKLELILREVYDTPSRKGYIDYETY